MYSQKRSDPPMDCNTFPAHVLHGLPLYECSVSLEDSISVSANASTRIHVPVLISSKSKPTLPTKTYLTYL